MSVCMCPCQRQRAAQPMHTMTKQMIREAAHKNSTSIYDEPPGLAHSPPGGRNQSYDQVKEVKLMTCE
eukprot:595562-Amphidinium_carterae.1